MCKDQSEKVVENHTALSEDQFWINQDESGAFQNEVDEVYEEFREKQIDLCYKNTADSFGTIKIQMEENLCVPQKKADNKILAPQFEGQ